MKFVRRFNLKNTIVLSVVIILSGSLISMAINNYYYEKYYKELNDFVGYLLYEVQRDYPNASEEEIINILNSNNVNIDKSLLKKYGIDLDKMPALKSYENIYKENVRTSLCLVIVLGNLLLIIFLTDNYIKNNEIRRITKTLNDVNSGNYELKLENHVEGDLSILNDEIYKTTLMLREKAEESIKGKNDLKDSIANISHQLKTPLTSMLIMIDNLIEGNLDKKIQQEFLKDIRSQIEQMNFLIIALLKLSRFDANVITFKEEDINVKKLLFNVNKNISTLAEIKNIDIHLSGNNDVSFKGDYTWELEALTNIIKNCIEHSLDNKNIYITFSDNPFYTKIVIQDEGKGISKEEIKKIFERFYKGKDSSSQSIGIGLALAKEIIEKDNGTISVKSELEKGTTFTIKYFK